MLHPKWWFVTENHSSSIQISSKFNTYLLSSAKVVAWTVHRICSPIRTLLWPISTPGLAPSCTGRFLLILFFCDFFSYQVCLILIGNVWFSFRFFVSLVFYWAVGHTHRVKLEEVSKLRRFSERGWDGRVEYISLVQVISLECVCVSRTGSLPAASMYEQPGMYGWCRRDGIVSKTKMTMLQCWWI